MKNARNTWSSLPAFIAIFFIAMLSISTGAFAQNAYKCGNLYSATPCAGGIAIDTQDSRTPAQKAQSDAATVKSGKVGDAMEKTRLAQERSDAKARVETMGAGATVISPNNPAANSSDVSGRVDAGKKKNDKSAPEFFTAQAPGEKKEKAQKVKKAAAKTKEAKETNGTKKAKKTVAAKDTTNKP